MLPALRSIRSLAFAALTAAASPVFAESSMDAGPDIVDTAVAAGQFTTLVTAVQAAGLVETLKGEGPFTVFAPTDEAFAALPAGTLEALLADPDQLRAVLTYHVVADAVPASEVVELDRVPTVQGGMLPVSTMDGVQIGAAKVIQADIMASNGVIHVIDTVLVP
jgi:uncharacterized surface protein with fasciclin (FAS1) repeats